MTSGENARSALIVLGCPQVPVQTSIAIYLAFMLKKHGIAPVIAGTPAARHLVRIADPEEHYVQDVRDLERCIDEIVEKATDFSMCFVFLHNDAGMSYAATLASISSADHYTIIYGEHAAALAEEISFDTTPIVEPATHNPVKLKRRINEVMQWDA